MQINDMTLGQPYPEKLYSAQQVKEIDRRAIETHGISGFELMQNAARFTFHVLLMRWPQAKHILVLCGSGNNAGDGYIIAALAKSNGYKVTLLSLSSPHKLTGDALLAYNYSQEKDIEHQLFSVESWPASLCKKDSVIVDALLGTGLNKDVSGNYFTAIELCNKSDIPILSVDIPSGLCANTGQSKAIAIEANCTATFIGLKIGLFTGSGQKYCGQVYFDDLGVPENIIHNVNSVAKRLHLPTLMSHLKPRGFDAHKGQFGHVLLIGGDHGYGGAILMAAEAAARMGAGLVSVATQAEHCAALLTRRPEVMATAVNCSADLDKLLENASVIVIGPGLGQSAWSCQMLTRALKSSIPTVLDADALNLICQNPDLINQNSANWIMTPHPGEASRMLACSTKDIQNDRVKAVRSLQKKWGGSIILKGSGSLIANNEKEISLCPYGNPGMATGGTGDVLSGMLGGLIAQEFDQKHAIELAVCLHAAAADIVANKSGERGLLASDIIPVARQLLNKKVTL